MATLTPYFNLNKDEPDDSYDVNRVNANTDTIDKGLVLYLGTTAGSGGAYTVSSSVISALSDGLAVAVKFHEASAVASTLNINGIGAKAIKKAGGTNATNIKASIYTLRYDAGTASFILQGEGGSGNATASDLLSDKTATTDAGEITGTMTDNGPTTAETITLTTQNQEYTIAAGYHSGLRKIKAVISNLAAGVIKAGVTVGGIAGTFTADATATAAQILSGITAYVNGNKITGTIPSKAAQTYTPGTSDQTIAAGQYLSGAQTIKGDANLIAANILSGKSIFGVAGSLVQGKKFATGACTMENSMQPAKYSDGTTSLTWQSWAKFTGLTFTPSVIILMSNNASTVDYVTVYNNYSGQNQLVKGSAKVSNYTPGNMGSPNTYNFKVGGDGNYANVTSNGFTLPVHTYAYTASFIAFE